MKKILLGVLVCFTLQTNVWAINDVKKISLYEAIDIALKNNIDLKSSRLNLDIAQNEIAIANRLKNPSIEAFYFWGGSGLYEPRQAGVSQVIEIGKRGPRKELAKVGLKLAEKNVNFAEFEVKMNVREAYIDLVATKSIYETLKQQEFLQEELLKLAQNRVKTFKAPQIEEIQAEIALNQLLAQLNIAKANVNSALAIFNKVINTSEKIVYDTTDKFFDEYNNFDDMYTPAPDSDFPSIEHMVKKGMVHRFDIQIAKREIEVAEKNLQVVLRQRIPNLRISGGFAYIPGKYMKSGNFNGGAYTGVSIDEIPLFYSYSPEIKNASKKLEQARLNYESIKNKASNSIKASYERFLMAADNLNHYEYKIVTDSAKLIETSKRSYELGQSDITSLIVMKQSYKAILIGYTQALTDYYKSWTNFLREINDEDYELCNCEESV